jgi:hypothetical protein
MKKKAEEATALSTLQDPLIFQMAMASVTQTQIREAVGVDMNRVNRLAKLAKQSQKNEEE